MCSRPKRDATSGIRPRSWKWANSISSRPPPARETRIAEETRPDRVPGREHLPLPAAVALGGGVVLQDLEGRAEVRAGEVLPRPLDEQVGAPLEREPVGC